MKIVIDHFLISVRDIQNIMSGKGHFKKIRVFIIIKKLKRMFYKYIKNKDSFDAFDLTNFALLIKSAREYTNCKIDDCLVEYVSPEFSRIVIDVENSQPRDNHRVLKFEYSSTIQPGVKFGEISMKWSVTNGKNIDTYEKIVHTLTEDPTINGTPMIINLLIKSYMLLPEIFTLFMENILESMEERYLK